MFLTDLFQQIYVYSSGYTLNYSYNQLLSLFFLYSLMGWGLETVYRSLSQRRFFNPGFLTGPIVPLYGFAGIFIVITISCTHHAPVLMRLAIYFTAITVMEFLTGEIMLRLFKRRFWDYTENALNVRGHICLPFSLAWALLSLVSELTIHPLLHAAVGLFNDHSLMLLNGGGLLLLQLDFIYSLGFRHTGHLQNLGKRFMERLVIFIPGIVLQQVLSTLDRLKHQLDSLPQPSRHLQKIRKKRR